jgi:hypothetical protein
MLEWDIARLHSVVEDEAKQDTDEGEHGDYKDKGSAGDM